MFRYLSRCLCVILCLGMGATQAQGGFKKFYYLPGSLNSTAADAMETPDHKYLVAGRTDTLMGGYIVSRLTFMATDLAGNKLWTRSYGDLNLDYPDFFQRNQFYCAETNYVYVCCTGRDNFGNLFPTVTKINYQGDTLWQKRYYADPGTTMVPQVMIRAADGGFYLCGYYNIKTGGQPIFLVRLSENGDLLWKNIINKPAPNVMSASDMLQDTASRKLVITGYQHIGNSTFSSVLFLDSLGNKTGQKSYNNACGGAAGLVIQLKDGNFLTGVQMSIECDYGIYQGKLVKFDIQGNVVWTKLMYPYGPINAVSPIHERANGDFLSIGTIDSSYYTRFKYILLDSLGNIKRQSAFGRVNDVFVSDLGRGGSITPDGSYITAMQLKPEPGPSPFYIIKIDSLGCDTTPEYCAWERTVGLKELKQTLQAEIFPNPCSVVLNVGLPSEGLSANVTVFDQAGREVLNQKLPDPKNKIDISALSDGIYLLVVRSNTGVFRSNFVVQK